MERAGGNDAEGAGGRVASAGVATGESESLSPYRGADRAGRVLEVLRQAVEVLRQTKRGERVSTTDTRGVLPGAVDWNLWTGSPTKPSSLRA